MSDPLGLSIGTFNLVAARTDRPPVVRRSIVTLFSGRAPEVGAPEGEPATTELGLVLSGFVERVGGPTPLIAADGSAHRGEELLADALDALGRLAGYGTPVTIAFPAHWGLGPLDALRVATLPKPGLAADGMPPLFITDVAAATAVLRTGPGLPPDGVVALCDFGGGGTSITLLDAAGKFAPIGLTVRHGGFSGDAIDQAILEHLLEGLHGTGGGTPAGTTAVASLTRLRDECRSAKERLSTLTETSVPIELPGYETDLSLTRSELENILAPGLAGVLKTVTDTLTRNAVAPSRLSGVAIVGGGANIPAVGEHLSTRLQVPVITTPEPGLVAATGAAMTGGQSSRGSSIRTRSVETPTRLNPTAWAAGTGAGTGESGTFRALAWSQDGSGPGEPVPYTGADYTDTDTGPAADLLPAEPGSLTWYKRPAVLFGLAAALALAATGGLAYTLTGSRGPDHTPDAPVTVTITAPDGSTSVSTIPPSSSNTGSTSSASSTESPSTTTTTEASTTTTTAATTTTTAVTTATTTSAQPTTTQATTQPTTSAQPPASTTAAPSATLSEKPSAEPTEPTGSQ